MASASPRPRARILLIDDDPQVCDLLAVILNEAGFAVRSCQSADAAAARLEAESFELVITDHHLPGRTGLELIRAERARHPEITFLMATGADDARTAVEALQSGATDYLVKPLRPQALLEAIEAALDRRRQSREAERARSELEQLLALRTEQLGGALERAREYSTETLQFIGATLDARAREVAGHSRRVCRYALELARGLGYAGPDLVRIERGAQLHDIGKLGIPDAILNKPGPLTPEETALMRTHVQIGLELVARVPSLQPAAPVIAAHHERYEGGGYPAGLVGESIPLDARVFAVADALDAMTSNRPYRDALSWDEASAEIVRQSGRQFDPAVVSVFAAVPRARWLALRRG
jgi:putative nucleotidyltransferase with HDIG domain